MIYIAPLLSKLSAALHRSKNCNFVIVIVKESRILPRIYCWEIVSRRGVGPWRHLHNSVDNDNVLFLEARLNVISERLDKQ
jgi:hypothetical protein